MLYLRRWTELLLLPQAVQINLFLLDQPLLSEPNFGDGPFVKHTFRLLCSLLQSQIQLNQGSREQASLGDPPAETLHNQPMGVAMFGALVVPALKPGILCWSSRMAKAAKVYQQIGGLAGLFIRKDQAK